jgi:biopolymer transport protein ExbB/TolQ
MGGRMNFAPRMPTIIVALALILVGLLGTFAGMLPAIAGLSSQALGAWSFVAAAVVLFVGMIFEGI